MRTAIVLLALALSVSACKKKEAESTGTTTTGSAEAADGSGSDTGSAATGSDSSADPATAGSGATMTKRAGNCPSTVVGSTTTAEVKDNAVVVTITSENKDAIATIQRRADELLAEKTDAAGAGGGHDQKGTHGGAKGICPVYKPEGATATAAKTDQGVVVTITPKDNVAELETQIQDRIAKSAEFVKANMPEPEKGKQGGIGGGKGEHGGNHSGQGDSKGVERKGGDGTGGGAGTGGGGGKGTGGGDGKDGDAK